MDLRSERGWLDDEAAGDFNRTLCFSVSAGNSLRNLDHTYGIYPCSTGRQFLADVTCDHE